MGLPLLIFVTVTLCVGASYQLLSSLLFPDASRVRRRVAEEFRKGQGQSQAPPSSLFRNLDRLGVDPSSGGLSDLAEIREGDALETLAHDLPEAIDLVLLDGAKNLYPPVLALLESRLREGALLVSDNADLSPDYLARVRSPANGYLSVPFADDVEISLRCRPADEI